MSKFDIILTSRIEAENEEEARRLATEQVLPNKKVISVNLAQPEPRLFRANICAVVDTDITTADIEEVVFGAIDRMAKSVRSVEVTELDTF